MNEPVFMADGSDPGMQRAVKMSQKTFRVFWRELSWEYRRTIPGLDMACVKAGFLGRLIGSDIAAQDPTEVAATEHPMAVNMVESLVDFAKDPENLTVTDEYGFTVLHQQCLAGAAGGVRVLLKHGADGNAKTSNGMTPFRLARKLGWKNVMKALEKHGVTS